MPSDEAIRRAIDAGRAAWPALRASDEALAARLARAKSGDDAIDPALAADIYLATACATGDPDAIAAFERAFEPDVKRAYARRRPPGVQLDDFAQTLREKLFSPPKPKVDDYAGAGPLRAWLRIVATRTLLDMTRTKKDGERPVDDSAFLGVPAPSDAPDLAYLKRLYGSEVSRAIQDAAHALTPEDRNVLRQSYKEGLSIDQIGALRGVHRATAARWVSRAREELIAEVRRLLAERLGLPETELESVLRLAHSEIHVTLERVLG